MCTSKVKVSSNYPDFHDTAVFRLTKEEINNPLLVFENFLIDYTSLSDIRKHLKDWYVATLLSELPDKEHYYTFCLYEDTERIIEAGYLLVQRHKDQILQRNNAEAMTNFLDLLAHELNKQFSDILQPLNTLLDNNRGKVPENNTGFYLTFIKTLIEQTKNTLNNMKRCAEYNKGRLAFSRELREIGIHAFLDDVLEPFSTKAILHKRDFEIQKQELLGIHINTDPNKLRQILENLLYYAFNNCTPGGEIYFKSYIDNDLDSDQEKNIIFIVSYRGSIPEFQLPLLFEPYSVSKEGEAISNLGLHISKLFAELLEGKILADNKANGFASFKVTLKLLDLLLDK